MTAVHQFVPTLAPRDAAGEHYIEVQTALRDAGYGSEIYAFEAKHEYAKRAHDFRSFDGGAPGEATWLLYQSSVGSPVADFVNERDEPLLVDYHNITPASYFAKWEPVVAGALAKGRRQLADLEPRASLGIAHSTFSAEELISLDFSPTAVVPVLLDIEALERAEPDPAVPRLDATTWLFVGRIAPNKAQHDIIKAFAVYRRCFDPTARLRLVGGSSSHSYQSSLIDFIDAVGLSDAIEMTGPVSTAALMAYYDTSDVLVVCSDHEGFLVPLLEAMYHRLPIVAYAAAAVPETLGDAGLTLAVKDAPTMAEAVHRVMTNDELRCQLVGAGERRLRDFSLEASRQKLFDALTPIVGAPA